MIIRIMASRHSAFYSPLLCAVKFLRDEGHDVLYTVLHAGQRSHALIGEGFVDIMQSAVSSNWSARESGIRVLPVHFAQINRRDGFFLTASAPDPAFEWKKLDTATLRADQGAQPLAMLKYALRHNGVTGARLVSSGPADYGHAQLPASDGEAVASVGAAMPLVAFSSLCCARAFQQTDEYRGFVAAFARAKEWARTAQPQEVAAAETDFFPDIPSAALADAIRHYQALGTWEGGLEIPRDLYDQALEVFTAFGGITQRHPYEDVVG